MDDKHVTSSEAARILGKAPQTLANWRHRGVGPRFVKDPQTKLISYPHEALAEFIAQKKNK